MDPHPEIHMAAAKSFIKYDFTAAYLIHSKERIDNILKEDKLVLGCARTFAHYSINNFFLKENKLLDNIQKISHLPCIIIHGRYDTICKPKSAYELYKSWAGSELTIVSDASHSASEPSMSKALVEACKRMYEIYKIKSEISI